MATKHNKQLTEKVQEIKRMQANWMRQRSAQDGGDSGVKGHKSAPSNRSSRDNKRTGGTSKVVPKKQETMTWTVSSSSNKKNLRARSASPAGRQKDALGTQHSGRPARPSSGRSNPGSRPTSSRNNSVSNKPPLAKGSASDRSVSRKNQNGMQLSSRTGSEPNLCANNATKYGGNSGEVSLESDSTNYQMYSQIVSSLHDSDLTSQSETRTSNSNQSNTGEEHLKSSIDQSRTNKSQSEHASNLTSQSEMGRTGGNLLEADAFDRLADQIASRVKAEMRQERQEIRMSTGVPLKSVLDDDMGDESDILSSHHCIKCKQKMVPPDHMPTVLVPCGHTFCEPCAEDRIKCPTCRTKVSSTAENSTLLQIILGSTPNKRNHSTNKQTQLSTNHNPAPTSNHRYQPTDYTSSDNNHLKEDSTRNNDNYDHKRSDIDDANNQSYGQKNKVEKSAIRKRTVDPKVRAENYASEFESLSIRCEAMREEEETVMEDVEKTNREMLQHKKQMGNISRQQDRIREEIQQLQDKISLLEEHRAEYERKCEDLEEDKTEKMSQLHMVRQMLRQLEGSKDKVTMLARDLGVYLE